VGLLNVMDGGVFVGKGKHALIQKWIGVVDNDTP
jgi:hypothetical protein